MGLIKPNNEIDTNTLAQESTSQEIKLSNESIKAVADEILNKIGLTSDAGGVLQQEVFLQSLMLC